MRRRKRTPFAAVLVFVAACSGPSSSGIVELAGYEPVTPERLAAEGWRTDPARVRGSLSSLRSAGLPRTAFVPIVAGGTVRARDAGLDAEEPVIVVRGRHELRAWPIVWLLRRELVLDEVDGMPVAVTFCSLCSTARVWDRRVEDVTLDLAVSGMLLHGNSLLFDRGTESLWRQIDGRAMAGEYAGAQLRAVDAFVVPFGELVRAHPEAGVLRPPEPAPAPPVRLLRAEDVAAGVVPEWLTLSCPAPLDVMLEVGDEGRVVATAGPAVENLGGTVVFRDPSGAAAYRDGAGRASARTGTAVAFRRELVGRTLTFEYRAGEVRDRETGSRWNLLGEAVEGPLAGQHLEPAGSGGGFRFAMAPPAD